MHTIGQRLGLFIFRLLPHTLSYRTIGQQHKLFHQFVRIFRHLEIHSYRFTLIVYIKTNLTTVEIDGTMFETPGTKLFGQAVQRNQFRGKMFGRQYVRPVKVRICRMVARHLIVFRRSFLMVFQHFLYFFIRKTTVALNDRMGQMPVFDYSLVVQLENDTISQLLFVRT